MFNKFKSSDFTPEDFHLSIMKRLDYLLNEQRAQRIDLASLLRLANMKYSYYKPTRQTTLEDTKNIPEEEPSEDYGTSSTP